MEELSSNVAAAPPPPLDLSHHFSLQTKHRQPSAIKSFYKFFQVPGIGNLAGGNVSPSFNWRCLPPGVPLSKVAQTYVY